MARKSGSPRQNFERTCSHCDFITKKNSQLILHLKEKHGIEFWENKRLSENTIRCPNCGYAMQNLYCKSTNTKGNKTMKTVPIKFCDRCEIGKTEIKIICWFVYSKGYTLSLLFASSLKEKSRESNQVWWKNNNSKSVHMCTEKIVPHHQRKAIVLQTRLHSLRYKTTETTLR